MKSAMYVSEPRELNKWGREKLSPIERTTAFVIAVMEFHENHKRLNSPLKGSHLLLGSGIGIEANRGLGVELKEGERSGIEKKADNYYAVMWRGGMPIRVRLDKKMYEDYLSGKPFNYKLNYDDY